MVTNVIPFGNGMVFTSRWESQVHLTLSHSLIGGRQTLPALRQYCQFGGDETPLRKMRQDSC